MIMYDAFMDEFSKLAKLRQLGLTDPRARKNLAKGIKMLPKPERARAIKETWEGWATLPKSYKTLIQKGLSEAQMP